jgi:hypothetical protein
MFDRHAVKPAEPALVLPAIPDSYSLAQVVCIAAVPSACLKD